MDEPQQLIGEFQQLSLRPEPLDKGAFVDRETGAKSLSSLARSHVEA
jgi:hypothetical protein